MMKRFALSALALLDIAALNAQTAARTVCGYVRESETGETLPSVVVASGSQATTSNAYGYYSAKIDGDTLYFVAPGYQTLRHAAKDIEGGRLDVTMSLLHTDISEVTVTAESTFRTELQMARLSRHTITTSDIKANAVMFGEADAFKTLQCLPGVASVADGSVNLSVRGGSHDQNMILLDEATVYNPAHVVGLFTAFNPDALQRVDFYKSGYSPKYGGKLAAVADMRMKEGNNQKFGMEGSIGTIGSRLLIEGPIVKNVGSLMVAARMGYGDAVNEIVDFIDDDYGHSNDVVRFYDICAKTNWNISADDRLFASAYTSHDEFKCAILSQDNRQEWGNTTGTLRWNHIFTDEIFANHTLTYSNYKYLQQQEMDVRDFEWKAGMSEVTFKSDYDHYKLGHHLTYGLDIEGHFYNPGQIDPLGSQSVTKAKHLSKRRMATLAAYVNDELTLAEKLNLSVGLRLSAAINGHTYVGAEPRLALSYPLTDAVAAKASYARTVQYDHILTNSAMGMPTDIWLPISKGVKPQSANTFALGVQSVVRPINLEIFCEAYFKRMRKTIDYKDNADLQMNEDVESEIKEGEGRSAGLETMLKYESSWLTAQASYTLSESERRADEINRGNWYYAAYDQRHNLAINTTFHAGRNDFSVAFKYHTGGRVTLPYESFSYYGVTLAVYSERNGYQKPDFHRLDFSWCHNFKSRHRWKSQLIVALYNCYGRKNAYSLFVKGDRYDMSKAQGYMLYLYQWVPSVTYSFKF